MPGETRVDARRRLGEVVSEVRRESGSVTDDPRRAPGLESGRDHERSDNPSEYRAIGRALRARRRPTSPAAWASGTGRPAWLGGLAPIYVAEATGSHVTDVDGTTYVDYQMGQAR